MPLHIHNPYFPAGKSFHWVRGNLHAHTTNSDGEQTPQAVVDGYAARGYHFLAISDHDFFTDPDALDARGMVLIPGVEVTAKGPHVLHVNTREALEPHKDRQKVLDHVDAEASFAVIAHPNWGIDCAHCPQHLLEAWNGYIGIEIFNGVVQVLEGSPFATDRWDMLLGQGRRVWGFAHDDTHFPRDFARGWNMVQVEHLTLPDILRAFREGRFYASTGVTIESIGVTDGTIQLHAPDAQYIAVYGDYGILLYDTAGPELNLTVPADRPLTYVRVECWGAGRAMAWTQPFYIEP